MDRPLILRGKTVIQNIDKYIIGKVIKNKNIEHKEEYIQILDNSNMNLYEKGYLGYIFESKPKSINLENINYCYEIKNFETLLDYDVIEIVNNKDIKVLYRDDSEDNAILVTNQCNSNCIMCPDSDFVRNTKENPDIRKIMRQISCIPDDTKHITITGGEPGLLKENLIKVLRKCKECLPETEFLLLTNGKIFSNTAFTNQVKENIPNNIRIAIPIYADNAEIHDNITRAKNSFDQAVVGIKKLLARDIPVEIRIVVLKKNYEILERIAKFIIKEMPKVTLVNIMALEMTGNAHKNKEEVWINFDKTKNQIYNASTILIKAGINTNLYNFPLCNLDERIYSIARKSITDYKVRYKPECIECKAREKCGGFFNSTINIKDIKIKPIK